MNSGTILLDTGRTDDENAASLLFTDPLAVLSARHPGEIGRVLEEVDRALGRGYYAAGYLAYEAGAFFDAAMPTPPQPDMFPLAWFGIYRRPASLEEAQVLELLSNAAPTVVENIRLAPDRLSYTHRVEAARAHIHEGNVYQVNYTLRLHGQLTGDRISLFRTLRQRQRVAYGALLHIDEGTVISLSPELFFRRRGNGIVTRPMKGTVRRGRHKEEDHQLSGWLAADEKNRAENLMIVDLLRNDLSRICLPGSVVVRDLFTPEPYETLFGMTSTIEGELHPGTTLTALLRALFPCGSVTGAPKIRAMHLIRALEEEPRGVYCGAIGYAGPDDHAVFNVAIRTLTIDRQGALTMGVGSGIVWDSDPAAEYDECLLKARFLTGLQDET